MTTVATERFGPRFHAGLVLAICFTLGMVSRGLFDAYAVWVLPLTGEFGWDRAEVASVYAIGMAVSGLTAPLVGWLFDRWGPRRLYLLGLTCIGGATTAAGWYDSLWQFYLGIGVLGGFGATALNFVPHAALLRRWYRGRLTTALGFVYASNGAGVLLIAPLAQFLIDEAGWRQAYHVVGLVPLLLIPLLVLMPWRRLAAGHPALQQNASTTAAETRREDRWSVRSAVRSRPFWALFAVYFLTAGALYPVLLQLVAYLVEAGYDSITAATTYGVAGIAATLGLLAVGALADRIGRQFTVTASYIATMLGLFLLFLIGFYPSPWLLVLFLVVFGPTIGSRAPIVTSFATSVFGGSRKFGSILGGITLAQGLGGGIGAWIGGALHDWTGGYLAVLAFAFCCIVLASAQFWLVPELARR
jgi:MFS family permease